MFISTLGNWLGVDQSFAETDAVPINRPSQYAVYGGYGYAVEGQPVSQGQAVAPGGPVTLLLLVLGGLLLWKVVK